jgi:hypothetical protein
MVLVKPGHRPMAPSGIPSFLPFALQIRGRSVKREIRDLIRQMSSANPLSGAPRIHGELLKLGIEVSQATVAKYMVRRRGAPSPTWRSFLRNHAEGIAAIDMFVVASASFSAALRDDHSGPRSKEGREYRRHRASERSLALAPDN